MTSPRQWKVDIHIECHYLSYIYYKIHSFYICNIGNNFIHVSGLHILNGISVQN